MALTNLVLDFLVCPLVCAALWQPAEITELTNSTSSWPGGTPKPPPVPDMQRDSAKPALQVRQAGKSSA